jgi:hypothetical protein
MWQLLGVEHLLTWRRELFGPSELLGEWPQAMDTTYLHRLPEPGARAWVVGATRLADDDEAARLLADHTFDLQTTALLPPGSASSSSTASEPAPIAATVQVTQVAPAHLAVRVVGDGGLLLAAENWMPGWQTAKINCAGTEVNCAPGGTEVLGLPSFVPVRADLTLVGVPIPPGEVTFELIYQPESVRNGLWIAGVTLAIIMLATGWRMFISQRRDGQGA